MTTMPVSNVAAEPALRRARTLLRVHRRLFLFIGFAAFATVGCDDRGGPSSGTPVIVKPKHPPDSKLGKLDMVIERLKSGLQDAQAAQGSGVQSQRRLSYKLIHPDDNRAEVTIVTRSKLILDKAKAAGAKPKTGDPEAAPAAEKRPTPADVKPVETKETFVLEYDGDRWKLLEEPQGKTEQVLFEYALGMESSGEEEGSDAASSDAEANDAESSDK
jgi:hypothetical protein